MVPFRLARIHAATEYAVLSVNSELADSRQMADASLKFPFSESKSRRFFYLEYLVTKPRVKGISRDVTDRLRAGIKYYLCIRVS